MWAWAIGLFVLITILTVAAWQIGWIFKAENVERQVRIDNRHTGVQTAWHDQAVDGVRQFYLIPEDNSAARGAVRNQTCDLIGRLVPEYITPNLTQFQQEEC
jgi:hypothetical protein